MLTAPRARLAVGPSRPSASDKELDLIPATLRWHGPLHPPPIVGEGYVEHERYREVGLAVATRNVDDACQNRLVVVPRSTKLAMEKACHGISLKSVTGPWAFDVG